MKIEPRSDFFQLLSRPRSPHVTAVANQLVHEQGAIAREHDALFAGGDSRNLSVRVTILVERIEAQHAQILRQPAQLRIGDESRAPQRFDSDLQHPRDVERLEHWIHADAVTLLHDIGEVDGLAIREDQLDLGMWYAERLDRMLHRRATGAHASEVAFSSSTRKKVVEPEVRYRHSSDRLMSPRNPPERLAARDPSGGGLLRRAMRRYCL